MGAVVFGNSRSTEQPPQAHQPQEEAANNQNYTALGTGGIMSNSNTQSANTNFNGGSYNSSAGTVINPSKPREDSLPRTGRQDSMSFYTNFPNGPRFSTDSNSSISNFLNFSGDQPAYDSNGRGMSIMNNLFLPPTGSSVSTYSGPSLPTNPSSVNSAPAPTSQASQGLIPDYNSYGQFRRPSEQLESFNPSVKLKMPSFSKKPSVGYPTGTSFSENPDFDFFMKRDSVRTRQPSFLNPNFNEGYYDFFTKRDSIKNLGDDDLLKDVGMNKVPSTRSEPDVNTPIINENIPERPQTAMGTDNSQFLTMSQQYNMPPQPLSSAPPPPPTLQQQSHQPQPIRYDFNAEFQQRAGNHQQQGVPATQIQQPRPQPIQAKLVSAKGNMQPQANTKTKRSNGTKRQKVKTDSSNQADSNLPQRRNAIQPQYTEAQNTNAGHSISPSTTSPSAKYPTTHQHKHGDNTATMAEEKRHLLGATKVDQLMLVIQARKKGIHNQIPQATDGTILDNGGGILPDETELVGGIDKPRAKSSKEHRCEYCNKTFTQSTHLEVHLRSHLGLKPFECEFCGKRFTQGGNLRTHVRLHTGEKPYKCETCGRDFSRKGNLAAHKLTHDNVKPFQCRLDDCGKAFTQLGNLKAHQNRFHLESLNMLTKKLAETDPSDPTMSTEERELLEYFASLYKNSNRGIKGRGKKADDTEVSAISNPSQSSQPGQTGNFDNFNGNAENNIAFKNVSYQE